MTDNTKVVGNLKYRDRAEIIGLILQAVEGEPLISSKITYQAMLISSKQMSTPHS
jgi:predicted transcriptional regulator